ncbi:MAG: hypothetical protein HY293_23210 [Planctomycetes bacterium]|nr:hypothetical protein [Planctomycetota bacterium]
MSRSRRFLAALAFLVLFPACCAAPYRAHRRPRAALPSLEKVPETEEFEALLEEKGSLIESLLSIDGLVEPDSDLESARAAYRRILDRARPLVEKALPVSGAYGAALEVLGLLKAEGFTYDDEREDWSLQYGSISRCLLKRKGICLSFTLLAMALLDSFDQDSWAACYPRHVLVRVLKAEREIELESTVFGDPVVHSYSEDLGVRARKEGLIYTRSLERRSAGWLYLSERLWVWVLKRSKDARSFALLERAEKQLSGTTESIGLQWALRHHLRSADPLCSKSERTESLKSAFGELQQLIRWDPSYATAYLLLSTLYEQAGDKRQALTTLKRFTEEVPKDRTSVDVFVRAWWWVKRKELNLEEFRPGPEEQKEGEAYLERHYPFAERAWHLKASYENLFKSARR